MVDRGRLRALLDRIADETHQLRSLAGGSEPILEDRIRVSAAKYGFVVVIEACIDIGQHIIASEGLRAPADFADVFAVLGESGYVPPELVPTLQDMARFRNLLVHGYLRIDDRRVAEILESRLDDLDRFRREVAGTALAEPPTQPP